MAHVLPVPHQLHHSWFPPLQPVVPWSPVVNSDFDLHPRKDSDGVQLLYQLLALCTIVTERDFDRVNGMALENKASMFMS